ncbi:killer cell lectin-like receptor [Cricetulus griseus]|nr:killer cell lectin-like receptor [Cricetulus griseus]
MVPPPPGKQETLATPTRRKDEKRTRSAAQCLTVNLCFCFHQLLDKASMMAFKVKTDFGVDITAAVELEGTAVIELEVMAGVGLEVTADIRLEVIIEIGIDVSPEAVIDIFAGVALGLGKIRFPFPVYATMDSSNLCQEG